MRTLAACVACLVTLSSWGACAPIDGKVVGADGQPVAGASVWLSALDISAGLAGRPQVVGTTKTTADGAFALLRPDAPWAMIQIIAYAPESAPGGPLALGWKSISAETASVEIQLPRPGTISGTVIGSDGAPISGAIITPNGAYALQAGTGASPEWVMLPDAVANTLAVRSDATGAYSLAVFPEGVMPMLTVSAKGLGSVSVGGSEIPPKIVIGKPGGIKGRVVCPEDPAVCAKVQVAAYSYEGFGGLPLEPVATDASGLFTFEQLQPGMYMVQAMPEAVGYLQRGESGVVEVRAGEQAEVEIGLVKGAQIRGRVVMEGTGEPVAGVQVFVYPTDGGSGPTMPAATAADGRFDTYALPGEVSIHVIRPTMESSGFGTGIEPTRVTLPAEGIDVGDIGLPPTYTVTVKVVDEAGAPVSGASVSVRQEHNTITPLPTGSDGTTAVGGLVAGEYVFRAVKDDAASERIKGAVGPDVPPVTLTLKSGMLCSVTAKLLDQDGLPVTNAQVNAEPDWGAYYERVGPEGIEEPPPDPSFESTQSNAEGLVRITGLEPGWTYSLSISAPGCFPVTSAKWNAQGGRVEDLGVIALNRPRGEVTGVVVDGTGAPVAGARVANMLHAPQRLEATSDEAGRFTLKGLVEGEVFLLVEAPGTALVGVPVQTGAMDLRVTLSPRPAGAMGPPPEPVQPPLSREEREKLVRDLLVWAIEQMPAAEAPGADADQEEQSGIGAEPLLSLLAGIDPALALQLAAEKGVPEAGIKGEIGRTRLADDFDEALGLIKEGLELSFAAYTLLSEARDRAQANPALAARCAEAALEMAPLLADFTERISIKAQGAALLRDHDPERAAKLLDEARAEAEKLGAEDQESYARVEVAKALCQTDLAGALKLLEPIKTPPPPEEGETEVAPGAASYFYREAVIGIACRIAGTHPDRALELVKGLPAEEYRNPDQDIALVLGFFPNDRFDRALELARGIGTANDRALALARLCSIAPTERVPELIEQAQAAMLEASALDGLASLALLARRLGYQPYEQIALQALMAVGASPLGMAIEAVGEMMGPGAYQLSAIGQRLLLVTPDLGRRVLASPAVIASGGQYPTGVFPFDSGSRVTILEPQRAVEQVRQLPAGSERDFAVYQLAHELLRDPLKRETEALTALSSLPLLPVLDSGGVG